MRVVLIAAAVIATIASVLPIASRSDHHIQIAQLAATSAVVPNIISDTPALATTGAHCHIGQSCMFLVLPINDSIIAQANSAPEFPHVTGYPPSAQVDTPFHPPRILSQV
jgi:hypothetical protein